ncbi:LETM1-like protein-domain-containing protein [Coemansia spiralis]|nr:LETM1-like protein-domain-containing protein [Coemansia spiralis]
MDIVVVGLQYAVNRSAGLLCSRTVSSLSTGSLAALANGSSRSKLLLGKPCTGYRLPKRSELLGSTSSPLGIPKPLYFQSVSLSTLRGRQSGAILRSEKNEGESSREKQPKKDGSPTVPAKQAPQRKKTLMEKIKHEALHYWHGTKLFAKEVKLSSKLVVKVAWGGTLTRREQRQLRRTFTDTVRLVPFLLFVIIPFAELLLPVALKLFPNMLPSTYEDKATAEKKRLKMQDVRNEMARYLKETIAEMNAQRNEQRELDEAQRQKGQEDSLDDTSEFLNRIRSSGEAVSTADLVRVAHIFEDDLTLDNLSRPQLVSICRFMGVNAFGTDNYLRYQITNRMRYIRADDKMIHGEGIDSLSVPELQSACQSRGIRIIGVSPARMREELAQWIELHLEHNIPSTLLILSRIIAAGEPMSQQQQFNADALQATINSLPDNLVNEATLRLAEASGKATSKQKLDVLEEQEELIEDEDEQEKKKKKSEENAEARREEEHGEKSKEAEGAQQSQSSLNATTEAAKSDSASSSSKN